MGTSPPAAALNGLGDAYLDKGDVVSAADYYRQSAEAYAREGMYDNAIACCKKIRRYAPDMEEASLLLGRFYAAKGLRADAARELEVYADRMERADRKKEALDALTELVQLAPGRPHHREKLARLHAERGQHDAALEEYRAARSEYWEMADEEGANRVAERIADLERGPAASGRPSDRAGTARAAGPGPSGAPPPAAEAPAETPTDETEAPPDRAPIPLEIERTSYADEVEGGAVEAETPPPESEGEPPAAGPPPAPEGGGWTERVSLAERQAAHGDADRAAADLVEAAAGLGAERRWEEAVDAYRKLAGIGKAEDEHFSAWAEAARQAGMASLVLEALSSQARWHLEAGRRSAARRAAEEMLLVDPRNDVATEILNQVGSTLPRD